MRVRITGQGGFFVLPFGKDLGWVLNSPLPNPSPYKWEGEIQNQYAIISAYMAVKKVKSDTEKIIKKVDKKEKKEVAKKSNTSSKISDETRHGVLAVVAFVLALFFILAGLNIAGPAGNFFHTLFSSLFGYGYLFLPILCILFGISFAKEQRPNIALTHTIGGLLFLTSTLGLFNISSDMSGGYVGSIASYPFTKLFGNYAGILFLGGLLIISFIIIFDARPNLVPMFKKIFNFFKNMFFEHGKEIGDDDENPLLDEEGAGGGDYKEEEVGESEETTTPQSPPQKGGEESDDDFVVKANPKKNSAYVPPPLSLLEEDKGKPNVGDIKANANIIRRTLQNFGILVEMDEITIGPTVTRYALKPAEGMKLSRIVGLQNDLALALAAHPIRIEAPIPGKSLVGIEIPNRVKSTVGLATLLSDDKFQNGGKPLLMALGKGISGKSFFGNMGKMPHLLIAGATGSGKSVTIHALITSLLYRNGPEEMRFIMVDPKRVELTLYNKIPHLLTPVITDPKKAILALKWAAKEMDRRYDILESESVRDIESYHANVLGKNQKNKKGEDTGAEAEKMPFIVVIIDELADIMQSYPRELESAIVRLAQMSRAVGIHLILSTQRPSVNVITGLIKANIPARIALQVSSQIDSRTILDQGGAEKLLGAGDMLYMSGEMSQPERLQSAFISEEEVKKVVKYLVKSYQDEVPDEITLTGTMSPDKSIFESMVDSDSDDDDMYEEARMVVIEAGKASTSYLQRKLKVGYARAARLIDMLEERGVVGPGDGAKPREVMERPMDHAESDTI